MKEWIVEWMRWSHSTLTWFDHKDGMGDKLTKRIYKNGVNAFGVRGKPLIKWKD